MSRPLMNPTSLALAACALAFVLPAGLAGQQESAATGAGLPSGVQLLEGCYVPPTGLIYRTGAEGLPATCTDPSHAPFRWLAVTTPEAAELLARLLRGVEYGVIAGAPKPGGGTDPNGSVLSLNSAVGHIEIKAGGGLTVVRDDDEITITPGQNNVATGSASTVSGGAENTASGSYAVVPGGQDNAASGNHSLAAGKGAQSLHSNSFVWSDGSAPSFASTGTSQFLINAAGGVGIGTNQPAPGFALDVGGDLHTSGIVKIGNSLLLDGTSNTLRSTTGTLSLVNDDLITTGTVSSTSLTTSTVTTTTVTAAAQTLTGTLLFDGPAVDITTGTNQHLNLAPNGTGNVGIGTSSPTEKLDVLGSVKALRFIGDGSGLTGVQGSGLQAGTYTNPYTFSNTANQFAGTFDGVHKGDGSLLTGVQATTLAPGSYPSAYDFPNLANTFKGTFDGTHLGTFNGTHLGTFDGTHIGDGSGLTNVTATDLVSGTYTNQFTFDNPLNQFTGAFNGTFAGDGSGLTNVSATLNGGTFADVYVFPNPLNQFAGTFDGTHTGDGSGLTDVVAADLAAGTYDAQVSFTNAANQFTGTFSGDGSALTGVQSSGLAAGTYSNAYTFDNPANAFTGDGSGLTNVTATLSGGTFADVYLFPNLANQFAGSFDGTHTGTFDGAHTGTFDGAHSGDGSGLTNVTAIALTGGTYPDAYLFPNAANQFAGTFVGNHSGDGSALTGVQSSGLAAGTYSNAYTFDNPANAFTGDGSGLTNVTATLSGGTFADVYLFPNLANQFSGSFDGTHTGTFDGAHTGTFDGTHSGDGSALTDVVATDLAAGAYDAQVSFTNAANQFAGAFSGDGSALTGVQSSGLAAGTYSNAFTFDNPANVFAGDGSGLTGITATDPGKVDKAGDIMTGSLTFAGVSADIATPGAEDLAIMPGGNVGIGTAAPAEKLSVDGIIESMTGGVRFPDGTLQTSAAATAVSSWALAGNSGLTSCWPNPCDFMGTTNDSWLTFGVNNRATQYMYFATGTSSPNLIGGEYNRMTDGSEGAVIGGGGTQSSPNQAESFGVVAGGRGNYAGASASVGGGSGNEARGPNSMILGGFDNYIDDLAEGAAIIGTQSAVGADYSIILGHYATASRPGTMVIALEENAFNQANPYDPAQLLPNDYGFAMIATGGILMQTSRGSGVELQPHSGSWSSLSDRNAKYGFEPVDGETVLERLMQIPVQRWTYNGQAASIRHMGPTAQDFHAAFGLGEKETMISTVDIDGVNMAAAQALARRAEELKRANGELRADLDRLRVEHADLLERMARIEAALAEVVRR